MTNFTVIFRKASYTVKNVRQSELVIGSTVEEAKENLLKNKPFAKYIRVGKRKYNTLGELIKKIKP